MWVGGVRVIVVDDEKKILMVRQHHEERDIWMVPGGGIEEGENSIQASIREVKEETGLDITITGMAWHMEEVSQARGQRFVNYMVGKVNGGQLKLGKDPELDDDKQVLREVAFMSKEEIDRLDNVFPDFFRNEIWDILDEEPNGMTYYKLR
ncbi:MAG: NUDIX hydrolase [Eubacteriaceae bacterium]|nr:NUDIX hydrolase [Eubacteriaceae bacterium]